MIRESLNIKNMNPQGIVRKGYLIKSPAAAKSKIKSKLRKWTRKWFVLYDIDMIKDGTHLQEDDEPPSLYYYDSKEHFEANKQPRECLMFPRHVSKQCRSPKCQQLSGGTQQNSLSEDTFYYPHFQRQEKLGVIDLDQCLAVREHEGAINKYDHILDIICSNRIYNLSAETKQNRDEWFQTIKYYVDGDTTVFLNQMKRKKSRVTAKRLKSKRIIAAVAAGQTPLQAKIAILKSEREREKSTSMSSEPDESDDGPKYDGPKFPGPNRWASGISERSSSSSGYLSGCSSRFSERNASLNSIDNGSMIVHRTMTTPNVKRRWGFSGIQQSRENSDSDSMDDLFSSPVDSRSVDNLAVGSLMYTQSFSYEHVYDTPTIEEIHSDEGATGDFDDHGYQNLQVLRSISLDSIATMYSSSSRRGSNVDAPGICSMFAKRRQSVESQILDVNSLINKFNRIIENDGELTERDYNSRIIKPSRSLDDILDDLGLVELDGSKMKRCMSMDDMLKNPSSDSDTVSSKINYPKRQETL